MRIPFLGGLIFSFIAGTSLAGDSSVDDFAIRDGDTVGFLGDSITAEGTYSKLIENYVLLRYPERKVRFVNLGWGGDTAVGGLARLKQDVFDPGITVLTVAYGINDIGWGGKADEEHRNRYLESIRDIVRQCRARGVRVFICSAAVTASDPDESENGFLQQMCDEGMAIARDEGGHSIDVQRTMRSIQRRVKQYNANVPDDQQESLHADDGIHLNKLGQTAMAYAILNGLGGSPVVSSCRIDATRGVVSSSTRCSITNVRVNSQGGSFERLDQALPFNIGAFDSLTYRFVPLPDINRYALKVDSLAPGKYELTVDGRDIGVYSSTQLAEGVDIASATPDSWLPGGPWDAQASALTALTESRSQLAQADKLADHYLGSRKWVSGFRGDSASTSAEIENLQREVAKPRRYRFVLTRQADET